jgi:hypothetical protein
MCFVDLGGVKVWTVWDAIRTMSSSFMRCATTSFFGVWDHKGTDSFHATKCMKQLTKNDKKKPRQKKA